MKHTKFSIIIVAVVAIILTAFSLIQSGAVRAQQDIFEELTAQLIQDGVPIKSSQLVQDSNFDPSFMIHYMIQSSSEGDSVAPEDPLILNTIGHEVNLASRQGLNIGAFRTTLINMNDKVLVDVATALDENTDWPINFDQSCKLNTDAVSAVLEKFPTFGMSRKGINVSLNHEDLMTVVFEYQTKSVETANVNLSDVIMQTESGLIKLHKERGTRIAVYQILIYDDTGDPILKYINDLQFGCVSWWQADGLVKDWFPQAIPAIQ